MKLVRPSANWGLDFLFMKCIFIRLFFFQISFIQLLEMSTTKLPRYNLFTLASCHRQWSIKPFTVLPRIKPQFEFELANHEVSDLKWLGEFVQVFGQAVAHLSNCQSTHFQIMCDE